MLKEFFANMEDDLSLDEVLLIIDYSLTRLFDLMFKLKKHL